MYNAQKYILMIIIIIKLYVIYDYLNNFIKSDYTIYIIIYLYIDYHLIKLYASNYPIF